MPRLGGGLPGTFRAVVEEEEAVVERLVSDGLDVLRHVPQLPLPRGLHSSTFRLKLKRILWDGGAFRGCLGG